MKTKTHEHEFKTGRSQHVETCLCGKWRNVISAENPAIVGIDSAPQHTPTPWEERPMEGHIFGADGTKVTMGDGLIKNRAYIVRAVNSHEELVESLKMAIEMIESMNRGPKPLGKFRQAIAKAEGR